MKKNIEARIKRNKLDLCAGKFYVNNDSDFIKDLKQKGFSALVGIRRDDDVYTVIGNDFTYYCSNFRVEGQISHDAFLKILKKNALKFGKTAEYEFVEINESCSIWVLNIETMNAIWNTIMFLHNE
ncbi:hypothetical protein [Flavobacterium sp. Root186]|uniref:hypothetical protein n=1 Tax=Flavobacterium sp. Root186 TaxID=1736485 RepID=UPI0006FF0D34|nr:hypothetical protein [Flavobacterium sp. Root186]KRB56715.1 hypothetical protein ASD98_08470 [Flavobacterium sp. Root186]